MSRFHCRTGKFVIPTSMIQDDPQGVMASLSGILIVRAEQRWDKGGIEYIGLSERFDETSEGETIPRYVAVLSNTGGRTEWVRWDRSR